MARKLDPLVDVYHELSIDISKKENMELLKKHLERRLSEFEEEAKEVESKTPIYYGGEIKGEE